MTPEIRAAALDEARSWIGTPYRHQASVRGSGADCLGLVRGVWRALYRDEPEAPPPYRPDWAERFGEETLLDAARRRLIEQNFACAEPGDVLLFRYAAGHPAKHCAILCADARMIHAWHGRTVCETGLTPWWRRRLSGVFAFPSKPART
ncbi:MAG: NlpC/P60 family protein [Alphaproteobacteria bacterium]|nr:NlpC/P60 family protein [Alphaproteobacteria bacterium]